ncbi:MAG: peptidoglycan DD-metalloendopeptidase family protein [Acidimicrobiia bacterium]
MRLARVARVFVTFGVAVAVVPVLGSPAAAAATVPSWVRPVDGAVVRPFTAPAGRYGAGHRGADLAAAPGTPVRAAGDGTVVFAGSIGGSLHVTVLHDHGLRTSYSFLAALEVREGQSVTAGEVLGATGATDPDSGHDGASLHFGLRVGDDYVDPMALFAPVDLAAVVHLAPAGGTGDGSWSPAVERRALASALASSLPVPGGPASGAGDEVGGDCGDLWPMPAAVVDAVCDVGGWVGDHASTALDAGFDWLQSATGMANDAIDTMRAAAGDTLAALRHTATGAAVLIARTPVGQVVLDLVEMGRRFADGVTAECSTDAPDADGTGGSAHRVMVVAGINSEGAGDQGPTTELDVAALGYREAEGEVRWFSYAADGGAYTAADTYGPIKVAARRLFGQLRAMQQEQPGREVDLLAHSQGGVVVDWFLTHLYHPGDLTLPPLGNVVTLSSPHQGAPLATTARKLDHSLVGGRVLEAAEALGEMPPADSAAVRDLAEGSPLMEHLWEHGVPDHVDFTTIGAPEDVVVPADRIGVPGATETVQPVDALNEHHAIVRDPNALRAVRAALEHRAPPCVSLATALRSAVAPVVISRTETSVGDALSGWEVKVGGVGNGSAVPRARSRSSRWSLRSSSRCRRCGTRTPGRRAT